MLVFDIGTATTFKNLTEWLSEVDRYAGNTVHKILIGNKSDRADREVPTHLGSQFAQENDMPYMETSAKNADNVDKLFEQLAKTLKDTHMQKGMKQNVGSGPRSIKGTVQITKPIEEKNNGGGGCC